jgi:hypothetical protein
MALKKRKDKKPERDYTIDEMFYMLNRSFIEKQQTTNEHVPHYILSPTCHDEEDKRWLLQDSREDAEDDHYNDELPVFYGETIRDCIYKAFKHRGLG